MGGGEANRRNFLKQALAGGAALAATSVASAQVPLSPEVQEKLANKLVNYIGKNWKLVEDADAGRSDFTESVALALLGHKPSEFYAKPLQEQQKLLESEKFKGHLAHTDETIKNIRPISGSLATEGANGEEFSSFLRLKANATPGVLDNVADAVIRHHTLSTMQKAAADMGVKLDTESKTGQEALTAIMNAKRAALFQELGPEAHRSPRAR